MPEILQSFQVHLHLPTDVNRLPGGNQIHWSFTQCLFEWILILVVVCKKKFAHLVEIINDDYENEEYGNSTLAQIVWHTVDLGNVTNLTMNSFAKGFGGF